MIPTSFTCPCCGFHGLEAPAYHDFTAQKVVRGMDPPYHRHFGMPSYEVCACCGFEFGNDDDPGTAEPVSFEEYLKEWIESGCVWFDESKRPPQWSLEEQLAQVSG